MVCIVALALWLAQPVSAQAPDANLPANELTAIQLPSNDPVEVLPPLFPEFAPESPVPGPPGGTAAPVIAEFLSDPNPLRRLRGVEAIESPGTGAEVETLLMALMDEDPRVRHAAGARLAAAPPRSLLAAVWESERPRADAFWEQFWRYVPEWRASLGEPLTLYLERDDITGDQAALAAYALGLMRHGEAGDVLARRVWVQHEQLAYRASEALLRLGDRGSRAEQARLLQHPFPLVRRLAVHALGLFGDDDAVNALHATVLGQTERDLGVRQAAVAALASVEPRLAIPVLVDLIARVPGLNLELRQALIAVTGVDNGRDAGTWRQWYEAYQLYEAGEVDEANRRLEALQVQRSFRLR